SVPLALAQEDEAAEQRYTAQSLWGAKHLTKLDYVWLFAREPWLEKPAGRGIRIGLIDTGIDLSHPDLAGSLACASCWNDFVGDRNGNLWRDRPYDDHGHGTHIAGILVAHGHLQPNPFKYYWLTGLRGVAPDATLIVAKAMKYDGTGEDEVVARAIRFVMDPDGDGKLDDGADVINLSIGIEKPKELPRRGTLTVGSLTKDAIRDAIRAGVPVVVSSGNEGKNQVSEPGDIEGVITVAATDKDGRLADFSNVGPTLDLLAPGVLVSSYPVPLDTFDFAADGYVGMAGTSMAAPIVTGTIALMMEGDPALSEKSGTRDLSEKVHDIQDVLRSHVRPAEETSTTRTRTGIVNAYAAFNSVDQGTDAFVWWPFVAAGAALLLVFYAFFGPGARRRRRLRRLAELEEDGFDPFLDDEPPPELEK
ncbi:MAG: S8 family peptidase, partial [Methanobacteriota archaeon]